MERVERIEDLDVRGFCAQGTVDAGAIIRTFTVSSQPAVWRRIIRGGFTRKRDSSCRSTFSVKCSGASSYLV
jgi:hypothetical protein